MIRVPSDFASNVTREAHAVQLPVGVLVLADPGAPNPVTRHGASRSGPAPTASGWAVDLRAKVSKKPRSGPNLTLPRCGV